MTEKLKPHKPTIEERSNRPLICPKDPAHPWYECEKCGNDDLFIFHCYFPMFSIGKYAAGMECPDCDHWFYGVLYKGMVRDRKGWGV